MKNVKLNFFKMKQNEQIDIKIDNELKKKELSEKYGAFFGKGDADLPPEIESAWLNYVDEFEKQFENVGRTTVWEYIGKPVCQKITELNKNEISSKLNELYDLLNKNNIVLDTICDVEEEELYRFITEELFEHEMDDMRIPGMTSCYIYEEFHPNAEHDIESAIDYFFKMTMGKMKNIGGTGYDLLYIDEENYCDANGNAIDKEKVKKSINDFLDSFDLFNIDTYKVKTVVVNETKDDALIEFIICYRGIFKGTKQFVEFNGSGRFKLRPSEFGGWGIYHIDMPGLII